MQVMADTASRERLRRDWLVDEAILVPERLASLGLDERARAEISAAAAELVAAARGRQPARPLEAMLARYGIASQEGTALLCLAEALLRVPDGATQDELIADKLQAGDWQRSRGGGRTAASAARFLHLARSLTAGGGRAGGGPLRSVVRPLCRPFVRAGVLAVTRRIADRFVHGRSIAASLRRSREWEARGYTHSYDMLGEGARTEADAERHLRRYIELARALEGRTLPGQLHANPGLSIKLSAIHPRYEAGKRASVVPELADRVGAICRIAHRLDIGVSIDAEESERLELSLDVFEAVRRRSDLEGWEGLGMVTQAYGKRAMGVIDWAHDLARRTDSRICLRLVKGAYWDTEIKRAQVLGLEGFPVFTRKAATDVSYLACARRLLAMTDRIYPQFGTHNAHTLAAILHLAPADAEFEFQRIHGMGEEVHEIVRRQAGRRHRIYAPVGEYADLLAYLVRRMLENGANSSFVQQIADTGTPAELVARDPLALVDEVAPAYAHPRVIPPAKLFGAGRRNARGWDIDDFPSVAALAEERDAFARGSWETGSLLAVPTAAAGTPRPVLNPARPDDQVGEVILAGEGAVDSAFAAALDARPEWVAAGAAERAGILERAASLYETHAPELMALACREAGKTWPDAIGEIREAVDFLRFYAGEARAYEESGHVPRRGVWVAISPWNFPLAIFTGQVASALAAGSVVLAKPASQTCLIAARATTLLHEAGVPPGVLQLLLGSGGSIGSRLVTDPRLAGVGFTGSTETARMIERSMAWSAPPHAPLVAETGGLNAMIVDSTALPERAVDDIVASAFQSAGQRCSALRILYVQRDGAETLLAMLRGAMDALRVGDPADLATDLGPVIDAAARQSIDAHIRRQEELGNLLHRGEVPEEGNFVAPTLLRTTGIEALEEEVFGPVLHVATYAARDLDRVVDRINASGYGLTLAVESRIDHRARRVAARAEVGNVYLDRNQIGAVVGSQPFGGEGLSGTGPKAGGPHTLAPHLLPPVRPWAPGRGRVVRAPLAATEINRALRQLRRALPDGAVGAPVERIGRWLREGSLPVPDYVRRALGEAAALADGPFSLPGPTGELNELSVHPRGSFLCLGDLRDPDPEGGLDPALAQALAVLAFGNGAVAMTAREAGDATPLPGLPLVCLPGRISDFDLLATLEPFAGVCAWGEVAQLRAVRIALAERPGPILPLITGSSGSSRFFWERSLCADTTASGGNASLFAATA